MAILELRSLTRSFGRTQAVRGVSFCVERGQVYGLLGPNGSGKTTTLACALGLLRPSAGEARVLGFPASRIHATRGRVGAVFDGACLLSGLTVRANLEYARRLLGHDGGRGIDEVLELVGIGGLAARRAGKLSLGQAKRVAVARALLGRPELLVLDEPLSALDTPGVGAMLGSIESLAGQGVTLVLSSHRLHEMERVITHAGILSDGRLVAEGSLESLLGGGVDAYCLAVRPRAKALDLTVGLAGVVSAEPLEADGDRLRVVLDGMEIGALNRGLIEAGCTVSVIEPERRDLVSRFESLVREPAPEVPG